jgi:predicted esterase YcpF (UPF0227 family)
MTVLYLHGLDSNLSTEKANQLQQFGTIIAPDLNYRANPFMIETFIR